MKIKSNTTNKDLPGRFGLYQRPSSEENHENGTNSSSGSCHGSDVTWQEIYRTCGSVCSCPHALYEPGSGAVIALWRHVQVFVGLLAYVLIAGQVFYAYRYISKHENLYYYLLTADFTYKSYLKRWMLCL